MGLKYLILIWKKHYAEASLDEVPENAWWLRQIVIKEYCYGENGNSVEEWAAILMEIRQTYAFENTMLICDIPKYCSVLEDEGFQTLGYCENVESAGEFSQRYLLCGKQDIDVSYVYAAFCHGRGIPAIVTETARLRIREVSVKDVPRLYELYEPAQITAYMEGLFENRLEEEAYVRAYIEKVYAFYGYGMWVVELKEENVVIGRVGIEAKKEEREMEAKGVEIGVMIGLPYQRRGYAEEACRAVISYSREILGQESIYCKVHTENQASFRLFHKLGFCRVDSDTSKAVLAQENLCVLKLYCQ